MVQGYVRLERSGKNLIWLIIILICGSVVSQAQSVSERDGNIYFRNKSGQEKRLTTTGRDSQPNLSPDGLTIVFVRRTERVVDTVLGDSNASELWLTDRDGTHSELLVSGSENKDPKKSLAVVDSPQFSLNGNSVYFLSSAWVTSQALHVVDIHSRVERFICDANTLEVIRHGKYRGDLVVQKHKYFSGGGSYDDYWLLSKKGKELLRLRR